MAKILIVEDDLDIQELLQNFYRKPDMRFLLLMMALKLFPYFPQRITT